MFVFPLSQAAHSRACRVAAGHRLFDESLDRVFGGSSARSSSRTPAMDVTESDTAYTVVFDVPGVSKDRFKVSVEGRRVSIETTEPPANEAQDSERVLYRERSSAPYARTVSLPAEVDQAASQAKFDNGVLTLTLAKKVRSGATQLQVN